MTATFRYIHHACFTVTAQGETLICDPFLDGNPTGVTQQDLSVDYILSPTPTAIIWAAPTSWPNSVMP